MKRSRREAIWDAAVVASITHVSLCILVFARPGLALTFILLSTLALALGMGGAVILHHGGHMRYSQKWYLNAIWVHAAAPVGLWVSYWGLKHRIHHKAPAIYPDDLYTSSTKLLRLHPAAQPRPIHRYQHIYIVLAYAIFWLLEISSQVRYVLKGSSRYSLHGGAPLTRIKYFLSEKAMCAVFLVPYIFYRNDGLFVLSVLLISGSAGSLYAGLLIGVGHINVGLEPGDAEVEHRSWLAYVISSTTSFSVQSRVAGWFTGGLTLHAAHHIRPIASRRELREVHRAMRARCAAGEQLLEFATFGSALRGHFAMLRTYGRPEEMTWPELGVSKLSASGAGQS